MTLPAGYTLISLPDVDSTNDEAARRLHAGTAGPRSIITATSQRKGRGRYGRQWTSETGNLYASLILKPAGDSFSWAQLGFVLSLSIAEAVKDVVPSDHKTQLKWPNDVLVDDKKIAGILLEVRPNDKEEDALVLGFGVNCISHPEGADVAATDLKEQGAEKPEPQEILESIMGHFDAHYELWQEKGFPAIRSLWLSYAKDYKKEIAVRHGNAEIKGEFADIGSDDGALYIKKADGETTRIAAGDVYFS